MRNKLFNVLLSICMLCSVFPQINYAYAAEVADYSEIVFDKQVKMTNMSGWSVAEVPQYEFAEREGKTGLVRTPENKKFFLCLHVNDEFLYSEEPQAIAVTVEYYDEGTGKFTLRYDSSERGRWASPEIVYMTGANEWKTHTFYIDDALIKNSLMSQADIELGLWATDMGSSASAIVFHSIKIEKAFPQNPLLVSAESENYGNIYGRNDSDEISLKVSNITDSEFETKLTYEVKNSDGLLITEGKEDLHIEPKGEAKVDFHTKAEAYGIYDINVKLVSDTVFEGENLHLEAEKTIQFSKVLTTEEGDSKNDYIGICAHLTHENPTIMFDVISKAGFCDYRDEYNWHIAEQVRGQYQINDSFAEQIKMQKEKGLGKLQILTYSNPLYITDRPYSIITAPKHDSEIEAFANYAAFMARELKKEGINEFEVWNEWNIASFNAEKLDGAAYAKLLKAVYPAIKKENPDATVYGIACASADVNFIRQVFEEGGADYMDGITIHPYEWDGIFNHDWWLSYVRPVHKLLDEYGLDLPVVFSEIGWTSGECEFGVGEKNQAIYHTQLIWMTKAYDLADKMYLYVTYDDGTDITDPEQNFGIIRNEFHDSPYSAKEAYLAIAAINRFMADGITHKATIEKDGERATVGHCFDKSNGEQLAVLWSTAEKGDSLTIDLGCSQLDLYDYVGNKTQTLYSDNGIYSFSLHSEPVYIMGSFKKFEESTAQFGVATVFDALNQDEFSIPITGKADKEYRIEASCNEDYFNILNISNLSGGKGEVKLKVSDNATGQSPVYIKIYDQSQCVFRTECIINISDPIKAELKTMQFSENSANRWRMEITIENLANSVPLSGKCRIIEPANIAEETAEITFSNLQPKSTRRLYINLPELVKKRTEDIKLEIELDSGFKMEYEQTIDFTSAQYAYIKPKIDGKMELGEWQGNWVCADSEKDIFYISSDYKNQWGGPEGLSITGAKFMWDEENFYLMAIVKDDIFDQKNDALNMWNGDCIQFGIEDKNHNGAMILGFVNRSFTEIGMALLEDGPAVYRYSSLYDAPTGIVENCEAAVKREGTETIYELKIPWTELFEEDTTVDSSKIFGFSMLANDSDYGYRWGLTEYNSGIGKVKDSQEFGRMTLYK